VSHQLDPLNRNASIAPFASLKVLTVSFSCDEAYYKSLFAHVTLRYEDRDLYSSPSQQAGNVT
jgi:hypothetical protein